MVPGPDEKTRKGDHQASSVLQTLDRWFVEETAYNPNLNRAESTINHGGRIRPASNLEKNLTSRQQCTATRRPIVCRGNWARSELYANCSKPVGSKAYQKISTMNSVYVKSNEHKLFQDKSTIITQYWDCYQWHVKSVYKHHQLIISGLLKLNNFF